MLFGQFRASDVKRSADVHWVMSLGSCTFHLSEVVFGYIEHSVLSSTEGKHPVVFKQKNDSIVDKWVCVVASSAS